ncbi:MAG TPA: hypothetical protein VEA92_01685 [Candidatus Paceibacterota bacterium]|nr:hypothetical protein [Candidatus Paceibacterota bacterium]
MIMYFRLMAALITIGVTYWSSSFLYGAFYLLLGLLFQFALFIWVSFRELLQLEQEIRAVLSKSGDWVSTQALRLKIVEYRLEQELSSGALTLSKYRTRKRDLHLYGAPIAMVRSILVRFRDEGAIIWRNENGSSGDEWRRGFVGSLYGPWGPRPASS